MPKGKNARHVRSVLRAVTEHPWAILPEKLGQIVELLNLRASGETLTREEIRVRIGAAEGSGRGPRAPYQVTEEGIAVIPLYGVLAPKMDLMMQISGGTSTERFARDVRAAAADAEVKAIVLAVDSPGGSVLGLEEAAQAVRAAAAAKPVISVAAPTMASAAYYIASAADEVVAGQDSMVGSIGTVSVHLDRSKELDQLGRRYTVIAAGENKWAAHEYAPLSERGRKVIEEMTSDYYEQFVASVAASRKTTPEAVKANYGQGKVFIGHRAVHAGLADRVGSLDSVLAELRSKLAPPPKSTAPFHLEKSMNKIIEKLVALGLVASGASEPEARVVLAAWYAGRGQKPPNDEAQILADLSAQPLSSAAPTSPVQPPAQPVQVQQTQPAVVATPAGQADERLRQQAALAERDRIANLRARGQLLGVDPAAIDAAIDAGTSVEQFLMDNTRAAARREQPVGRIEAGESSRDRYQTAAVEALALRAGLAVANPSPGAAAMRHRPLAWYCEESLRVCSGRSPVGDRDDMILAAMGDQEAGARVLAGGGQPLQGPGAFPNLLSALANRTLEGAPTYVGTTFQNWAYRRPSVPDFKPATLVRFGEFSEFPLHVDGDNFEQSQLSEDYSWIQVDSYGDEFGLTPVMIVNDDLGAFLEALTDKQNAHDQTLNRLCVNLLTGNVACADGVALFHLVSHINDAAVAGAPSTTTLAAMRLLLRSQTGVGANRKLNYTIRRILVPEALETTTQQLLAATLGIYPTTETATPIFKGQVAWDVEPMLTDHSATEWYGFMEPSVARSIVYAYQTGYETMKRRDYYNPQNNCRMFQFEGRFAAAINNWRGIARNTG